jgi:hypothetical protein
MHLHPSGPLCALIVLCYSNSKFTGNRRLHTRQGVCTPDWLYVKGTGVRHLAGAQTPNASTSFRAFVCLYCLYAMATENLPGTGVCTPARVSARLVGFTLKVQVSGTLQVRRHLLYLCILQKCLCACIVCMLWQQKIYPGTGVCTPARVSVRLIGFTLSYRCQAPCRCADTYCIYAFFRSVCVP